MIKIIFFTFIISIQSFAADFKAEIEIDRINSMSDTSMSDKKQIHKELLKLKKQNLEFKIKLMQKKSYEASRFHYTLTLKYLLEKIPNKLSAMPNCKALYHSLLNDYKTTWEKLEQPTHHIWTSFEKICKS